jgi:hypothetical protein
VCAASLREDFPSSTLGYREEVLTWLSCRPRGITGGYRDHSFTSRIHGNTAGAASAVVRPKQRCAPRRNQNCQYSHDSVHRRTACSRTRAPLLDRCRGKGTPATHSEGARRAAQASLFSTSIGAVAAAHTDFQLSSRWFKIPAPRMSSSPWSRRDSRAPTSNTRDKLRLDQQRYGLRIPFGHEGRSSLGVYPTTMENYCTGGAP